MRSLRIDRRTLLRATAVGVLAAPGLVRAEPPVLTRGVQSGDAPPAPNASPAQGFLHVGEVEVAPTGELRVTLRGPDGQELWSSTLPAVA